MANVHLSAVEHKDRIVFMHHVDEGPASQSYGLAVAQLAGVPPKVIREARRYLVELENQSAARVQPDLFSAPPAMANSVESEPNPALDMLQDINPDELTPRQALDFLYQVKKLLN